MVGAEPREARGQPERGDGDGRGDNKLRPSGPAAQIVGRAGNVFEGLLHDLHERFPFTGERDGPVQALEQPGFEMLLQDPDMPAHGLTADRQLFGGAREA